MRHGGFIPFLPGIIKAIKSNKAHKQRVKTHRAYMDRLKQQCGPNCKYSESELHSIDKYKKQARENLYQESLMGEAQKQLESEQQNSDKLGFGKKRFKGGRYGGVKKRGGKFTLH
jgi:hypothetical protein